MMAAVIICWGGQLIIILPNLYDRGARVIPEWSGYHRVYLPPTQMPRQGCLRRNWKPFGGPLRHL